MARNGSGGYSLPSSPFVYDTVADEAEVNANFSDLGTEIANSIAADGQTNPTANLPMAGFRHTGVGDATQLTQYASAKQVQNNTLSWCGTAGGTANAITLSPSIAATDYVAGQVFEFIAASNNSGAVTVSVSGLTAKNVRWRGAALSGNEIVAGKSYSILYDGTQFQISALSGSIVVLGEAKAWVTINGSGSIQDSFGVSGVVKNGTGDFTITFSTAFQNITYAIVALSNGVTIQNTTPTTTTCRIKVIDVAGTPIDPSPLLYVVAFGRQ